MLLNLLFNCIDSYQIMALCKVQRLSSAYKHQNRKNSNELLLHSL